jgi:hypothetical protein
MGNPSMVWTFSRSSRTIVGATLSCSCSIERTRPSMNAVVAGLPCAQSALCQRGEAPYKAHFVNQPRENPFNRYRPAATADVVPTRES